MYIDKIAPPSALPIKSLLKQSWKHMAGCKKPFFFSFLMTASIFLLFHCLRENYESSWLLGIISLILMWLLSGGLFYMGVCRASNMSIRMTMLFRAFNYKISLKLIATYAITLTLLLAPMFLLCEITKQLFGIYLISFSEKWLIGLCCAAGLILSFALLTRLVFAKYLVITQYANPISALSRSLRYTRHNFWQLVALQLLGIGALLIGVLTLGIGLIWAIPFNLIIFGLAYKHLVRGQVI